MYPEKLSQLAAVVLSSLQPYLLSAIQSWDAGMPRALCILSAGVSILECVFDRGSNHSGRWVSIAVLTCLASLKYGAIAGDKIHGRNGLECRPSHRRAGNFVEMPVMDTRPNDYEWWRNSRRKRGWPVLDSSLTPLPQHTRSTRPICANHFNSAEQQADAAGFAMWLFLLTEVMSRRAVHRLPGLPQTGISAFVAGLHQLNGLWGTTNTACYLLQASPWPWPWWCARRGAGARLCYFFFCPGLFFSGLGFFWASRPSNIGRISRASRSRISLSIHSFLDPQSGSRSFMRGITTSRLVLDMARYTSFIFRSISLLRPCTLWQMIIGIGIRDSDFARQSRAYTAGMKPLW